MMINKNAPETMLVLLIGTVLLLSGCGTSDGATDKTNFKPNIVVILTDDQQFDAAGFNGNTVIHTPAIDRLAANSRRFTQAHVAFALCSPSRAAILTGRFGSANGVLELNSKLKPGEQTIANYLKAAGYATGMSGKWHLPTPPDSLGFDFYNYFYSNGTYYGRQIVDMGDTLRPEIHCDAYSADRSVDFIREQVAGEQPFFLFHCTQTPHMDHRLTWPARPETKARYDPGNMPVPANRLDDLTGKPEYLQTVRNRTQARKYGYPDSAAIQEHTLEYYAVITEMDDFIDRVLRELDAQGIADETYVFFLSDNGWMLGDHGFTSKVLPYRPSSRIPFLVQGPDIRKDTSTALVSNLDVLPTILDLVGLDIPGNIHGKSLVPILQSARAEVRPALIYEGLGLYGGARPNLSVITDELRYIVTFEDATLQRVIFRELYDQRSDPWEMNNLAEKPEYAKMIRQLEQYITNHQKNILHAKS